MGTFKKWGPNGDPKTEKGPHGDPGPQMGIHVATVDQKELKPIKLQKIQRAMSAFASLVFGVKIL